MHLSSVELRYLVEDVSLRVDAPESAGDTFSIQIGEWHKWPPAFGDEIFIVAQLILWWKCSITGLET